MRLTEMIESSGINEQIYSLAEKMYRKGYNDGFAGRNRIFQDAEMDKIACDLIGRVIDNEIEGEYNAS